MIKVHRLTALGMAVVLSLSLASPAMASSSEGHRGPDSAANSTSVDDQEKILSTGHDGFVRTVEVANAEDHGRYELRNRLNLLPEDSVEVSPTKDSVVIRDSEGRELGSFLAPTVVVDGKEIPAQFDYADGYLSTSLESAQVPASRMKGCGRGTAAKWIWRGAGTLTCTAAGVATIVGGAACGLAWAGAEDAMNIDRRACK
ncbi:MAG: hypothetical protein ACI38U_03265 [Corynebacterium sp.]|uniref:hypothetical protein n=1 Tax=Corynebacterium sp. TaxID=1720 RepID=UPI003F06B160